MMTFFYLLLNWKSPKLAYEVKGQYKSHTLFFRNVKHVAETKLVSDDSAHVKFKCIRDAKRAVNRLNNHEYRGNILFVISNDKVLDCAKFNP